VRSDMTTTGNSPRIQYEAKSARIVGLGEDCAQRQSLVSFRGLAARLGIICTGMIGFDLVAAAGKSPQSVCAHITSRSRTTNNSGMRSYDLVTGFVEVQLTR